MIPTEIPSPSDLEPLLVLPLELLRDAAITAKLTVTVSEVTFCQMDGSQTAARQISGHAGQKVGTTVI